MHITIFGLCMGIRHYQYFSLCGSCITCTDVVYISLLLSKLLLSQHKQKCLKIDEEDLKENTSSLVVSLSCPGL